MGKRWDLVRSWKLDNDRGKGWGKRWTLEHTFGRRWKERMGFFRCGCDLTSIGAAKIDLPSYILSYYYNTQESRFEMELELIMYSASAINHVFS